MDSESKAHIAFRSNLVNLRYNDSVDHLHSRPDSSADGPVPERRAAVARAPPGGRAVAVAPAHAARRIAGARHAAVRTAVPHVARAVRGGVADAPEAAGEADRPRACGGACRGTLLRRPGPTSGAVRVASSPFDALMMPLTAAVRSFRRTKGARGGTGQGSGNL